MSGLAVRIDTDIYKARAIAICNARRHRIVSATPLWKSRGSRHGLNVGWIEAGKPERVPCRDRGTQFRTSPRISWRHGGRGRGSAGMAAVACARSPMALAQLTSINVDLLM